MFTWRSHMIIQQIAEWVLRAILVPIVTVIMLLASLLNITKDVPHNHPNTSWISEDGTVSVNVNEQGEAFVIDHQSGEQFVLHYQKYTLYVCVVLEDGSSSSRESWYVKKFSQNEFWVEINKTANGLDMFMDGEIIKFYRTENSSV